MKRPLSVTLLGLGVLLFAIYNAGRTAAALYALNQLRFVSELDIRTPVIISLVIGIDWAFGFALASIGLWRLKEWGRRWMLIAIVAYQIEMWIERFTLERVAYEQLTRPLDAIVSILIVLLVWGFLFLPKIRRAFKTEQL